MAKENKECPSYDSCGNCVTHLARHDVKCKDTKCLWHNIEEFNKARKELFKNEN